MGQAHLGLGQAAQMRTAARPVGEVERVRRDLEHGGRGVLEDHPGDGEPQ
ncbi:hypothetical protein HEP87_63945 [Streptomyces sp. S1D4-11]